MHYALFYNIDTDDIELYPKLENHNHSKEDIEKYLNENNSIEKWIIFDHLPDENDIEEFEDILSDDET